VIVGEPAPVFCGFCNRPHVPIASEHHADAHGGYTVAKVQCLGHVSLVGVRGGRVRWMVPLEAS